MDLNVLEEVCVGVWVCAGGGAWLVNFAPRLRPKPAHELCAQQHSAKGVARERAPSLKPPARLARGVAAVEAGAQGVKCQRVDAPAQRLRSVRACVGWGCVLLLVCCRRAPRARPRVSMQALKPACTQHTPSRPRAS